MFHLFQKYTFVPKKIIIFVLLLAFIASPLQVVFASENGQNSEPSQVVTPTPSQIVPIYVPVYLFADHDGGVLAIAPVAENLLIWAYATSTESAEIGFSAPQYPDLSTETSPEAKKPKITPLGVLIFAVGSKSLAGVPFSQFGEGVGLATTTTYTYATNTPAYLNPHAVATTTAGSAYAYTYDNNGNLLTVRIGTSTPASSYTWDYNNRLTQSVGNSATSTYSYSPDGQRIKMTIATSSSATTYYPTKYYNITGSTPTKHIFLPDGTMIATIVGTGTSTTVSYIHTDHLGGMNVATDDSGAVVSLEDMYPYGNTRIDEQNGLNEQRKGISGHEYDPSSGLTYANSRYYNATNAKFVSQDPMFINVGFDLNDPQSMNAYAYARNNPLRYYDPNGKWFQDFLMGRQSWNSFSVEVGDAANYLYDNSGTWQTAMDHPYATGAVVGVAGGLTAAVAAAAAPTVGTYLTSTEALTGAGVNVAGQALQDLTSGEFSGVGAYTISAVSGAVGGSAKGGALVQGAIGATSNYLQQKTSNEGPVNWTSVAISGGSQALSSKIIGSKSLRGLSSVNKSISQSVLGGSFETPAQVIRIGIGLQMPSGYSAFTPATISKKKGDK